MAVIDQLRSFALGELGFDLFGVTSAEPLEESNALASRSRAGLFSDIPYLTATLAIRTDPRCFLPKARSVICVAMRHTEPPDPPLPQDHVRVARYARRRDYHTAIRSRLVRLGRLLRDLLPGSRWRPAVDTAPLLERALAARAGLGFVGKSTMLVHPKLGPELVLGELVTTAELAADRALDLGCGSCRRCLDACPTGALVAPYLLDPRRCISCWTIECQQGPPPEAAGRLAGYLFGCDLCVLACPFLRGSGRTPNPVLATRPHLRDLPSGLLTRIDEAAWRTLGAGTPLRQVDAERALRNLRAATSPPLRLPHTEAAEADPACISLSRGV